MRNKTLVAALALTLFTGCAPESPGPEPELERHLSAAVAAEALVITEAMRNPDTVRDSRGEWFEIANMGATPTNLMGIEVRDSAGTGFVIDADIELQPGQHAVLARNGDTAVNGGLQADYDWSGRFSLGNGTDDIQLLRDGVLIDRVDFPGSATAGVSESLSGAIQDALGNDNPDNWCGGSASYGDGDHGTPGQANDFCGDEPVLTIADLQQGDLVITEIMRNPDAVSDSVGEWFEVHNASDTLVELYGLVVRDARGKAFTVDTSIVVQPGAYVVFAREADTSINGGTPVDYVWSGSLVLANGADDLQLWADDTLVDDVAWDDGSRWDKPVGASIQLSHGANSNQHADAWCASTDGYGDGDLGTPGQANGSCEQACDFHLAPGESVQGALDTAVDGDTLCLDAGSFHEHIDFGGKDVTLRGAGAGATLLIGEEDAATPTPILTFTNSETADAVVEHLSIVRGRAPRGGSVYIDGASPTLQHVDITENWCIGRSDCRGTVIYAHESQASFTDVDMTTNGIDSTSASAYPDDILGGLVYVDDSDLVFRDVTFDHTTIDRKTGTGTTGQDVNGGIVYAAKSTLILDRVDINDTMISGDASSEDIYGGVLFADNTVDVTATNLRITGVELGAGTLHGGLLYADNEANISIDNGILAGTDAMWTTTSIKGGVVHVGTANNHIALTNVTLAENAVIHADGGSTMGDTLYVRCGWGSHLSLVNVDAYWNGTIHEERLQMEGDWDDCQDAFDARYVNAKDPSKWRGVNLASTPGFISVEPAYSWPSDTMDWWFDLPAGSGLIDAGDPSILDADGSRSDIGAHGGPGGSRW